MKTGEGEVKRQGPLPHGLSSASVQPTTPKFSFNVKEKGDEEKIILSGTVSSI